MSTPGKSSTTGPSFKDNLANKGSSIQSIFAPNEVVRQDCANQLYTARDYLFNKMRDRAVTFAQVQFYNSKVVEYNHFLDEYSTCRRTKLDGIEQLRGKLTTWRVAFARASANEGLLLDGEFSYQVKVVVQGTAGKDPESLDYKPEPQTQPVIPAPAAVSSPPGFTVTGNTITHPWKPPVSAPPYNPVPRGLQHPTVSASAMPAGQFPTQGYSTSGGALGSYSARPADTTSLRSVQSGRSGGSYSSGDADSYATFGASAEDDRGSDESRGNRQYGTPRESFDSQQHTAYLNRSAQQSAYANSHASISSASLIAGHPGGFPAQHGMGHVQGPRSHADPYAQWHQQNPQGASLYGTPAHGGQPSHYGSQPYYAQYGPTIPPQPQNPYPPQVPQYGGPATSPPTGALYPAAQMIDPLAGAQPRVPQGGAANPSAHGGEPSSSTYRRNVPGPNHPNNPNRRL